jgi:Na+/H+ antiporter NhaC
MEFDEMKEIWGAQNNRPLYTIDEKALQKRIQRKKHSVLVNISEWILIIGYLVSVSLLVGSNLFKSVANIFLYLEAAWMFAIVVYLVVSHIRRTKAGRRFNRSVHGDLDHAIHLISAQMRISQITRWNLLPMGAIMILAFSGWEAKKLFEISAVILVLYTLTFYASSKGLRANKKRKRALQVLKEKLESSSIP